MCSSAAYDSSKHTPVSNTASTPSGRYGNARSTNGIGCGSSSRCWWHDGWCSSSNDGAGDGSAWNGQGCLLTQVR